MRLQLLRLLLGHLLGGRPCARSTRHVRTTVLLHEAGNFGGWRPRSTTATAPALADSPAAPVGAHIGIAEHGHRDPLFLGDIAVLNPNMFYLSCQRHRCFTHTKNRVLAFQAKTLFQF